MQIKQVTVKWQPGGWDNVGQGLRSRQGPFSYLQAEHHGLKAEFVTQNQCFKWMWDFEYMVKEMHTAARAEAARYSNATWEQITDNGRFSCE